VRVRDRLRDLIDLVIGSLDEPGANGRALADRAHFSRDHLDRLLAAATGESPVALRRRLLLERAAWQLRTGAATPSEAAAAAGYGSLEAFSRAFARAYGVPPKAFAASGRPLHQEAPNGIHFHPPAGLLIPGGREPVARRDLTERMVSHHLDRVRELLEAAAALPPAELQRPLRPGLVVVWFEGEEATAALMAERLVFTLEVWVAAIDGLPAPEDRDGDLLRRFDRAATAFARIAKRIRDRGAWDDAFVDALCEPPQSFTYGGVLSHVLSYGAVRREALAAVLAELGAPVPSSGDPIEWEASRIP
jgi:AraC family transcriptional regulator